jgi:hypothetical protein
VRVASPSQKQKERDARVASLKKVEGRDAGVASVKEPRVG